jgi:hypothetical protein
MAIELDSKGRPVDQVCRYCQKLFTEQKLRKHLTVCKGPEGARVCDLTGAARARRLKMLFNESKKKKGKRSVFTIGGGAFGLGKSRKH